MLVPPSTLSLKFRWQYKTQNKHKDIESIMYRHRLKQE
jgi:hypothetical protein